jgi:hypothetical protein
MSRVKRGLAIDRQRTHYERAPCLEGSFGVCMACGGFAPAPPGFSAVVPLPIGGLSEQIVKGGMPQHPPGSVEATESTLGSLPSVALSSAQFRTDCTAG